jgi:hypothetical protein
LSDPQKFHLRYGCYLKRLHDLQALGFKDYQEYLNSDTWERVRGRKLELHPDCLLCKKPATQVHHLAYSKPALTGKRWQLLVSLCRACHRAIEVTGSGQKRTLKEANEVLFRAALTGPFGSNKWAHSILWEQNFKVLRDQLRAEGLLKGCRRPPWKKIKKARKKHPPR